MKNFVFISPNFPTNYWLFCNRLKENGMNVLGIGDCPYDDLTYDLKASLNEYYKVSSLENYDEVYRAVAFYIHKYGRIDWLESNNEYWLERDASLRKDFNILSGFHPEDMPAVKFKSKMKEKYQLAGIPVARYHLVDDRGVCARILRKHTISAAALRGIPAAPRSPRSSPWEACRGPTIPHSLCWKASSLH